MIAARHSPAVLAIATLAMLLLVRQASAQDSSSPTPVHSREVIESDSPPPSTYDRLQKEDEAPVSERSMSEQLLRTAIALAVVVGLIYLIFRLGLGKLLRGRAGLATSSKGNRRLEVLERLQLDPRSAVYVLAVGDGREVLLGAGEKGLAFLCELSSSSPTTTNRPFGSYIKQSAKSETGEGSADERSAHDLEDV